MRASSAVLAVSIALTAAALGACSKAKPTAVDPGFQPEGVRDTFGTVLVLWNETPSQVDVYDDRGDLGPTGDDVFLRSYTVQRNPSGTVNGMVFDGTHASGYEIFGREPNGGFQPRFDFPLRPTRRWLESGWELYRFNDALPPASRDYVGRGLFDVDATANSPITKIGHLGAPTIANITFSGSPDPDTIYVLRWSPVANAAYYVMHVYEIRPDLREATEIRLAGIPEPIYDGFVKDLFVGLMRAGSGPTNYKLNDTSRSDVRVLRRRRMLRGQEYRIRISAIDASGQLIAYTYGDMGYAQTGAQFERFPLGAVRSTEVRDR